ncbi:MAG: hypothetical protein AABN95_25285 [Acidobacteriota bacterium]
MLLNLSIIPKDLYDTIAALPSHSKLTVCFTPADAQVRRPGRPGIDSSADPSKASGDKRIAAFLTGSTQILDQWQALSQIPLAISGLTSPEQVSQEHSFRNIPSAQKLH